MAAWKGGRTHLVADQRIPALATRRRIRALYAMGWPEPELARRLDYSGRQLRWMHQNRPTIAASTARRVYALAEELGMTPGPAAGTRRYAARRGWPTMLAWDGLDMADPDAHPALLDEPVASADIVDHAAVQRCLAGDPPENLRLCDRRAAVAVLRERDRSHGDIAVLLRISVAQVRKDALRGGQVGDV